MTASLNPNETSNSKNQSMKNKVLIGVIKNV